MTSIRFVPAAVVAAFVFASPASAQDAPKMMMMENNQAMMTMPNGEMSATMMMDEKMMMMALENAAPVEDGTIFFMSDGRMYMMQDSKMEGGRMMSEEMMMAK